MTQCKHETLNIIETGDWITEHTLEDGEWSHNNDPGGYFAMIEVRCYVCGLSRRYSRNRLPKWLQVYYDQAINPVD